MESNFFNSPEKPQNSNEEKKIQVTVVDYSDERIIRENILTARQLKPIDLAHLSKNVSTKNISQGNVGNCYFLAPLTALIEYDPHFLNKIMVYKDKKFHVTLYDADHPDHAYVYILDPTKVIGKKASDHTHDLIFVLEKAYALHRINLESKPLTYEEARIKEIYIANNENLEATLYVLLAEKEQKMNDVRQQITREMNTLKFGRDKYIMSSENDPKKQELLQYLSKHNGHIDAAVEAYLKSHFPEYNFFSFELQEIILSIQQARLDYANGLSSGDTMQAFIALLGNVPIESIIISEPYNVADLLLILTQIATLEPEYFDGELNKFLTTAFQNNNLEKDYFVKSIKHTDSQIIWNELADKNDIAKVSPQVFLSRFFQDKITWLPDNDGLRASVQMLLETFIKNEILYKRGTGLYTTYQLSLYEKVANALREGKLVTFATRERVSKEPDNTKGLLPGHGYSVSNAFRKDNLLFFEIRNVWAREVREYFFKDVIIDNNKTQVLTAKRKKQLFPLLFIRSLDLVGYKKSPRLLKSTNVARANLLEERSSNGFFAIELNDLIKRFINIVVATPPAKTPKKQISP